MKSLIKSTLFGAFASFLVLGQLSHAQDKDNTDVTTPSKRFWEANLPGGHYMLALDRISAISMHTYTISKSFKVHEINLQTSGAGLVRFYSWEMPGETGKANMPKNLIESAKKRLNELGNKAGIDTSTTVEKDYPTTTHAHTIEYKLFDKRDLDQLYSSLQRAFREKKGRKFTIN